MYQEETSNLPITTEINTKGHMNIGGCDTVQLANEYGTPLYVMDEETLRDSCRQYQEAFSEIYPNSEIVYASKAMSVVPILKIIKEEGLGLDVVSGGELYMALRAGFDPVKIYFHGNNKSTKELTEALEAGVGTIVVDNPQELDQLDKLAGKLNKKQNYLVRVTPGVEAHTHEFIKTGQLDSKFGIHADRVADFLAEAKKKKNVNFIGLHVHIGSQILEVSPFCYSAEVIMNTVAQIKQKAGLDVPVLNLGGGLGISYLTRDNPPKVREYVEKLVGTVKFKAETLKIKLPKIVVEPGRYIVGRAGVTLYTIGCTKELKGIRKFVFVDGGMADNPRPIMYQAQYDALVVNKIEKKKSELVTIAGKFCESGDILIKDIQIQPPSTGDILAVLGTGAYNYAMSSNYNLALRPAMVLVKNGKAKVIVRRETYDDLLRQQEL